MCYENQWKINLLQYSSLFIAVLEFFDVFCCFSVICSIV